MGEVHARAGDSVTCPNGHLLMKFVKTVFADDRIEASHFEPTRDDYSAKDGEPVQRCPDCGEIPILTKRRKE